MMLKAETAYGDDADSLPNTGSCSNFFTFKCVPSNRIRPLAKLWTGWAPRLTDFHFIAHRVLYSPAQAAEDSHWETWESCLRHVSGEYVSTLVESVGRPVAPR